MKRKSSYEVAIEKGDFTLPKDIAGTRCDPFEDGLDNFIVFWKWLGRPGRDKLYHLLMWSDHQRNRKETAAAIGFSGPEAVRNMLKQLKQTYLRNKARFGPR